MQKCKEMAGKLQGKVRATWDVKPDGSLDTGAPVDLAPNQLQRRGASLAYAVLPKVFQICPPLGNPRISRFLFVAYFFAIFGAVLGPIFGPCFGGQFWGQP